ncbi:MAG: hypothetical protein U0J38_04240 [Bacteroidales bacterium]|nr:hypothetical protein [Bacteroidales bacterium]
MTVEEIVLGVAVSVIVTLINEAYRINLKKEINEVKEEIYEARLDLKNDYAWLIKQIIRVYKKDKELMKVLKREVERSNEEE